MMTPWKKSRVVILAIGLLLALLVLASSLGSVASAAPRKPEPQAASNAQLVEGLAILHQTKVMLDQADHDYGGHRAAAVKAVTAAHHQLKKALEFQTKHKIQPGGGGGKVGGGGHEPQAQSDMQLGVSIATLKKTVAVLEGADHDYGGHRVGAIRDINIAIKELQAALKFEKRKK
jgi:hypothetical protein